MNEYSIYHNGLTSNVGSLTLQDYNLSKKKRDETDLGSDLNLYLEANISSLSTESTLFSVIEACEEFALQWGYSYLVFVLPGEVPDAWKLRNYKVVNNDGGVLIMKELTVRILMPNINIFSRFTFGFALAQQCC
jgi:hypothetical protein